MFENRATVSSATAIDQHDEVFWLVGKLDKITHVDGRGKDPKKFSVAEDGN